MSNTLLDDIIAVLEANGGRAMHKVDIQGQLAHRAPASVEAELSRGFKIGTLTRPKTATYGLPGEPVPAAWEDADLAPFQRINLLIRDRGPMQLPSMRKYLPGMELKRVIADMVKSGIAHYDGQDRVQLGENPRAPKRAASTGQQRWNGDRVPLVPPRDTETQNTPSEEEKRGGEASPPAEEPAAVATPDPAGDAPADSTLESPPPAMGPGEASAIDASWPGRLSPPSEEARAAVELISGPDAYDNITPLKGQTPMSNEAEDLEVDDEQEAEELAEKTAVFCMRGDDIDVRIEGTPSKVMMAVSAIDTYLRGAT